MAPEQNNNNNREQNNNNKGDEQHVNKASNDGEAPKRRRVASQLGLNSGNRINQEWIYRRRLPFEKQSLRWEAVENSAIMRNFPQDPHFEPFANEFKLSATREILAIGRTVCFKILVEEIIRLEVNDLRDLYERCMRRLVGFEVLGFDIKPVQELLVEKVTKKDKFDRLKKWLSKLYKQLVENNLVKYQLGDALFKLAEKLKSLREKKRALEEKDKALLPDELVKKLDKIIVDFGEIEKGLEEKVEELQFQKRKFEDIINYLVSRVRLVMERIDSIEEDFRDKALALLY